MFTPTPWSKALCTVRSIKTSGKHPLYMNPMPLQHATPRLRNWANAILRHLSRKLSCPEEGKQCSQEYPTDRGDSGKVRAHTISMN